MEIIVIRIGSFLKRSLRALLTYSRGTLFGSTFGLELGSFNGDLRHARGVIILLFLRFGLGSICCNLCNIWRELLECNRGLLL